MILLAFYVSSRFNEPRIEKDEKNATISGAARVSAESGRVHSNPIGS